MSTFSSAARASRSRVPTSSASRMSSCCRCPERRAGHVLVDGAEQPTYVAEGHLESDERGQPITHSWVAELCGEFQEGRYFLRSRLQ